MAATKITIRDNGPIRLEGDFEIVDQQGRVFGLGGRTIVSLCRCGHSQTKPFCDGTHKTLPFKDVQHARDLLPALPKPAG